jgi:hypothetical protein
MKHYVVMTREIRGGDWPVFMHWSTLSPGNDSPVPIKYEPAGWDPESGRRGEKSWSYRGSNSNPSVAQPVACRYTECANQFFNPQQRDHLLGHNHFFQTDFHFAYHTTIERCNSPGTARVFKQPWKYI